MLLYLLPSSSSSSSVYSHTITNPKQSPLPKTLFPSSLQLKPAAIANRKEGVRISSSSSSCSLIEAPVLWAGRVCIFYALLKAGLAGSPSNPFIPSDNGRWVMIWASPSGFRASKGDQMTQKQVIEGS
ncbi:uncharacterized protein M6B38_273740 [Iris pallida]|uniref:Uncharacterized protein n=1 Tax=Iris pallida TaxID=29817 RepID=A0AAX6I5W3_IRIPA|nr:uncharacterized protein M6B38_273740 [Iris pallida]